MADRYVGMVEDNRTLLVIYSSTGSLVGQKIQLEQLANPAIAEPPRPLELDEYIGGVIGAEGKEITGHVYAARVVEVATPLMIEAIKALALGPPK